MGTWKKMLQEGNVVASDLGPGSGNDTILACDSGNNEWKEGWAPYQMQWSCRWYLGAYPTNSGNARRRWYYPSSTYGPNYYQWNSYVNGENPRSIWYDTYSPCIYIPHTCSLRSYSAIGELKATSTAGLDGGDILLELKTNTSAIDYDGTHQTIPLSTVGTRQTVEVDESNYYRIGEADVAGTNSIANTTLGKGDILIPFMCRDFNLDSSTTRYFEGVFCLEFWAPIKLL